jgi:hypothetical protein
MTAELLEDGFDEVGGFNISCGPEADLDLR